VKPNDKRQHELSILEVERCAWSEAALLRPRQADDALEQEEPMQVERTTTTAGDWTAEMRVLETENRRQLHAIVWRLVDALDKARKEGSDLADPSTLSYQAFLHHIDEATEALVSYDTTVQNLMRPSTQGAAPRRWWRFWANKSATA
jgi:hypothetical protein